MRLNQFLFIGVTCLSLIGLVGCAGSPTKTAYSYYLLTTTPSQPIENQAQADRPLVIIKPIHLAKFLEQPGIVMQITPHQFQPARTHLWGESLDEGIQKALLQDLKAIHSNYTVRGEHQWITRLARFQLQLNITQFQVTNDATVVISGSYWITDSPAKNVYINRDFSFQTELTENGYEHAVAKLRKLIHQLSLQLNKSLTLLNQNDP